LPGLQSAERACERSQLNCSTPFTITSGLTEHSETYDITGGHERAQVLDVDLTNPNVRVGMVESHDRITDPLNETVTSMGARTGAVAGVNGDFFDISNIGSPRGGLIENGRILRSPRHNYNGQVGVRSDGSVVLGPEEFTSTVSDGGATHAVNSINVIEDAAAGKITRITPNLGAVDTLPVPYEPGQLGGPLPPSTLVIGHDAGGKLVVDTVQASATAVPQLKSGQDGLLADGDGGNWLAATVKPGDKLTLAQNNLGLTGLISGATMLIRDGKAYDDPTGEPPGGANPSRNPETLVGASKDGRQVMLVAIDGHDGTNAVGVTPAEATDYMLAHGVDSAVLFDGGGSTTLAGRQPGDTALSILNRTSDAAGERPVANGIFVYTTHRAGPARRVVVNGGSTLTTVAGGTVPLPVYARDRYDNPALGRIQVQVVPRDLASYRNGALSPHKTGNGVIVARDGSAISTIRLRVVSKLDALSISPTAPDLDYGATQRFTLSGTAGGTAVAVPADAARWSVNGAGSVDRDGLFTAAASGGVTAVTAMVGGQRASASTGVSQLTKPLAPLDNAADWTLQNNTGQPASLATAAGDVPSGSSASGSIALHYGMPAGSTSSLQLLPGSPIPLGPNAQGKAATSVGLWVKDDDRPIRLVVEFDNGSTVRSEPASAAISSPPVGIRDEGWAFASVVVPAGAGSVRSVDFDGTGFGASVTGTLGLSGLTAMYPTAG
jgi:exopolysaccharide biosynthesis protein